MGGKSYPVVDIIHPNAWYIKTTASAKSGTSGTMLYQNGLNLARIKKVIVDGVEYNDPSEILIRYGVNTYSKLDGAHEYYIYPTYQTADNTIFCFSPQAIAEFRFCRGYNCKCLYAYSKMSYPVMILDDNKPRFRLDNGKQLKNLYIPVGMGDYYQSIADELIEVKYNFIDD